MATPAKSQATQPDPLEKSTSEIEQKPVYTKAVPYEKVLVLKQKKKKKKKKKYSRGLRTIQELEVAGTTSTRRLSKALDKSLVKWRKSRNKSARKKRDGAIRDSLKNSSKGMRKLLVHSVQAPTDFLDKFSRMKIMKNMFN